MPVFRIHRMKDVPRQQFRWAPHVSGVANVKPKDYEPSGEIHADNEYAAWAQLRASATPLQVGDILEIAPPEQTTVDAQPVTGPLRICKYVGFEEAQWLIQEKAQAPLPPAAPPSPSMQV